MDRGQLKREKEKNKTDLKQVDRSIIQMNNILFLLLFGVFLGGGALLLCDRKPGVRSVHI